LIPTFSCHAILYSRFYERYPKRFAVLPHPYQLYSFEKTDPEIYFGFIHAEGQLFYYIRIPMPAAAVQAQLREVFNREVGHPPNNDEMCDPEQVQQVSRIFSFLSGWIPNPDHIIVDPV